MSTLTPWRQVVTPHADIRLGKFDSSVFAADLGEVLAGRGAVDYRDASTFFAKTYLTEGLSQLLIEVMQRLAGMGKTDAVIQLQTAFGGGKTHTLLTLYHQYKKPNEVGRLPQVKALVDAAGLNQIPTANVACLVGTALNASTDRTLWGELAFQLDGNKEGRFYGMVAQNDRNKSAPGSKLLGQMLQDAGPSLILMDEILVYLINAAAVQVGESTLRGQTLTFLQQLCIAVANCPHAMMVVTLTSQLSEFMDENAERAYESLEQVIGRVEKIRQTVEGTEIYEVIRRRLFDWPQDEDKKQAIEAEARSTAEAYWEMYRRLGEDVPSGCREIDYRDDIVAAYPFHPELISVLYERWGTITSFQRTRGVLRLLADVISSLYQAKDNEPLIQSCSVNLGVPAVRSELVKHTGQGNVFHIVVDSDISGKQAKAPEIDRQLGSEYAKESVSEKVARAVFMYSFSGGQQRGATLPQLRLAALNPEMAPPFVSDALDRMTRRLWYLYQDSGLYRFDARPNLNRILVDREELVRSEPEKVKEFARTTLNDLIGDATFRVYRYPQEDRDVADEPRLSLVVLDLHQVVSDEEIPAETEQFVTQVLRQHGKGFRKHANTLVFLAPDQQRASEVVDAARRLLALRNIDEDKSTKKQLSDEQLKDLADRLKEAEARLPGALATAYRHILVPAEKKTLRCFDLGISGVGGRTTLGSKVQEKLADEQQILAKLDPAILIGERFGLWPADQETINVRTLADYFTQLTHLPMLQGPAVLPECLAGGCKRGLFGYALGDGEKRQFDTIYFAGKAAIVGTLADKLLTAADCEIADSAWLLRPALAKSLMPEPEVVVAEGDKDKPKPEMPEDDGKKEKDDWDGKTEVVIKEGKRRLNKVRITMDNLPWENWNDVYNEVIDPLAKEGADVRCEVVIVAKGDAAIRENTVELGIKESLSQRGINAKVETG